MANQVLSLSLRPKRFSELFGQEKIVDAIKNQIGSKRIPRAWMLTGESGSGKTTLARIIGRALQCSHKVEFGEYCKVCNKENGVHEFNASETTGIDAIKEIAAGSLYGPVPPARRRVYILDEAQRLSKNAQDCLLKYFEDAPRTTAWIICTTEPEAITRTLRRRCIRYNIQQLRGKEFDRFVKHCGTIAETKRDLGPFIDLVHMRGVTSPGIILNAFELFVSGIDPDKALQSIDSEVDTLRICQALLRGEWGPIRSELEKATAADSRVIRSSVLGYLRGVLISKHPSVEAKLIASAIQDIGQTGFVDEAAIPAIVAASLWRACRHF